MANKATQRMTDTDIQSLYDELEQNSISYARDPDPAQGCVNMNYTFGTWTIQYTFWEPSDVTPNTNTKSQILIFKNNIQVDGWDSGAQKDIVYTIYENMLQKHRNGIFNNPYKKPQQSNNLDEAYSLSAIKIAFQQVLKEGTVYSENSTMQNQLTNMLVKALQQQQLRRRDR